jgi:zinc-binding alcohol dehydrogenase family protein
MKAVAVAHPGALEHDESLVDAILERPKPGPRDLLVAVQAISVNPVDTKVRRAGGASILGWDAAGTVEAVGRDVTLFAPGDDVFYAGAIDRAGSYAEYQAVDERLVGRKPTTLDFEDAAALPLTTLTAWELLFERIRVRTDAGSLLIVGAAGGVGSIATQLARRRTGLTVIATASRPDTQDWSRQMGAHHVVDHRQPLAAQVKQIVPGGVDYVLALTRTEEHFDQLVEALAPQGAIGLIDDPAAPLDVRKLKPKSLALHWEFMFTRARYATPDMGRQGAILNELAALVDDGVIRSTARTRLGRIDAAHIKEAHALLESGSSIGKVVLSGF